MQKERDNSPLDIDLGFLDEKQRQEAPPPVDTGYKYNWKKIGVIGAIVFGIGAIIHANNNQQKPHGWTPSPATSSTVSPPRTSTPVIPNTITPPSYSSDTVAVGQFRCTRYHSSQADQLKPKNSAVIEAEQAAMERRSNELTILRTRIEGSAVNSYSPQMAIDQYNGLVDRYNALLTSYQADSAGLEAKINQFNAQVASYNGYLTSNCTRR